MSELHDILRTIDDDYLVGLSNKGTVKRAYKDLEAGKPALAVGDTSIEAKLSDVECSIVMPLSDSRCSCPQIGVCRHIVTVILAAKEVLGENTATSEDSPTETDRKEVPTDTASAGVAAPAQKAESSGKTTDLGQLALDEIAAFPEQELIKKLGKKAVAACLARIKNADVPEITKGQIVTVKDVHDESIVKFVYPLSASGCTCHKTGLCAHKLKALLFVKTAFGYSDAEKLGEIFAASDEKIKDDELAGQTAEQIRKSLCEIMFNGLARLTLLMKDELFGLALISHNAGLANAETGIRTLGNLIDKYQRKNAAVTAEMILENIARLYLAEETGGAFRSEYLGAGELELVGLGARSFHSASGYAGETVYFIEKNSGEWYTFTNARADFYDAKTRGGMSPAPWNLGVALKKLASSSLKLSGGKVNAEHRLSSAAETRAVITGSTKDEAGALGRFVYTDFGKVWADYFEGKKTDGDAEYNKLILLKPAEIRDMRFDKNTQQLNAELADAEGRSIKLSMQYKKEESAAIGSLEHMVQRMERKGTAPPVFLGLVYIDRDEVEFYPIETVEELNDAAEGDLGAGKHKMTGTGGYGTEAMKKDAADGVGTEELKEAPPETINVIYPVLEKLRECHGLLADIFTGGLDHAAAFYGERITECREALNAFGLVETGGRLGEFLDLLEKRRHAFETGEKERNAIAEKFCGITKTVGLGIEISGRDAARAKLFSIDEKK